MTSNELLPIRSERILEELVRDGEVSVDGLAQSFSVSRSTIRRNLSKLEQLGLLRRNRGGAIPSVALIYEAFRHLSSFRDQEDRCAAEKRRIGLIAASLVADGETIAIGAGTTATQVARGLRHRKGITVLTNAINIAMELSYLPEINVCMTGGFLSGGWFALVGDMAQRAAGEIFVDKAFIGLDAIHPELGLMTNYPQQAAIHRTMLMRARQRIAVADHRKIGAVAASLICHCESINYLVTDKGTPGEEVALFGEKQITVLRG
jgi:DeoR family transcriptional regulator, aga operon transcriptional repressor